jgi:hypothetical protein
MTASLRPISTRQGDSRVRKSYALCVCVQCFGVDQHPIHIEDNDLCSRHMLCPTSSFREFSAVTCLPKIGTHARRATSRSPAPTRSTFASPRTDRGTLRFNVDQSPVTGEIAVPNTGGWQSWQTGIRIIGVAMDSNGTTGAVGNFDWFSFTN